MKNRVRQINAQSKLVEMETLSRLESLIRSTGPLPGRKVVFFISDGFVMDSKRSSGRDVMQSLANEAARVGAVVYTLDTRSNFFGASVDASRNEYPDFGSRTATGAWPKARPRRNRWRLWPTKPADAHILIPTRSMTPCRKLYAKALLITCWPGGRTRRIRRPENLASMWLSKIVRTCVSA